MEWHEFKTGARLAWTGQGYSQDTVRTYLSALRWLSDWAVAQRLKPGDVTTADLMRLLGSRPKWSRATRVMFRSGVKSAYRWAVLAGHVETNPAADIPPMRRGPATPRPAPEHAYASALRAADDDERLMLRLAAEAGLRRAEVAQVHPQRDMVEDLDGWSLWVHGKGSKDRLVPLPDGLARDLRLRGPGWLFPGGVNGHISPHTVGDRCSALLPPGMGMHALRHRFASVAYSARSDLLAVQQLLGHASPATTQVYVLTDPAARRLLVESVAQVSPTAASAGPRRAGPALADAVSR